MNEEFMCVLIDNENERLVLKLDQNSSHLYGSDKKRCPIMWEEVNSVIFAYSIIYQTRDSVNGVWVNNVVYSENNETETILMSVSRVLKLIINKGSTQKQFCMFPPTSGTTWNIYNTNKDNWMISLFETNKLCPKGCKFKIKESDMEQIVNVIDAFLNYMISYAEPAPKK